MPSLCKWKRKRRANHRSESTTSQVNIERCPSWRVHLATIEVEGSQGSRACGFGGCPSIYAVDKHVLHCIMDMVVPADRLVGKVATRARFLHVYKFSILEGRLAFHSQREIKRVTQPTPTKKEGHPLSKGHCNRGLERTRWEQLDGRVGDTSLATSQADRTKTMESFEKGMGCTSCPLFPTKKDGASKFDCAWLDLEGCFVPKSRTFSFSASPR